VRSALLAFLALVASPARAADVTGVTLTSISSGSLSISWTISAQSTPTIVLSTNNFSTTLSSGTLSLGQSATNFINLSANTTYYFQVKNSTEGDAGYTGFNAGKSTSTLATVVVPSAFTGVSKSSIQANWSANGNGAGVRYEAFLSSGAAAMSNGFAGNQSSVTANAFVIFSAGLSVNATYWIEIRALNHNSVAGSTVSVATCTLAEVPSSSPTLSVGQNQISAAWGTNGNPFGTRYIVWVATEATFTTPSASSNTALTSATITGLAPNTTYLLQVQALNFHGGPSTFTPLGSTSTLAIAPSTAGYTSVTVSSFQANWFSPNGPGTRYEAVLSSGPSPSTNGFTGNQSSTTRNAYAAFASLSLATTYYVEVRAVGNADQATAYRSLDSTATLANVPASSAPASVEIGSITARWGISSNPAGIRYEAQISADSGFATLAASSVTFNTFAIFSGLSANTTYYTQVRSVNYYGGASTFTALPTTSTLAVPPSAAEFLQVGVSSFQANWGANGNGSVTRYLAVLSTGASPSANGFSANQSSNTAAVSAVFSGLDANATYYVEVRAINNNGVVTAYAGLGATATLANLPGSASPDVVSSAAITANWTSASNPAGTRYIAEVSDSGFTTVLASSNTGATSATFSGLSPNTTYFFRVRSLNFYGGPSTFTTLPTTASLTAVPAAAAFSSVFVSSLQVNWTAGGNPSGTIYQVVLSSAASPATNGFPGNLIATTTANSSVLSGLTVTTTYYAAVRALNRNSVASAYADLGSTVTAASAGNVSPDAGQTIALNSASGEICIAIPAQAFTQAVSVSAQVPATFPAPSGSDLVGLGAGVDITVTPALQPVAGVDLTLGFTPTAGLDKSRLIIARYDPSRGVWIPLVSTPDAANNRVTARVTHFSLFQVMQAAQFGDLSAVKPFPNPLRPNQGQQAMTFVQLPAGARVRIYSYLGQLLRDLTADNAGMISWDGRSEGGKPLASGVYIALVEGGGTRRKIKVAIER
jgi:hypothetical protein